jgi:octaprenyl-diphosphate synthase
VTSTANQRGSRLLWDEIQGPVRRELERVDGELLELFRSPIGIVREVAGHFLGTRGKKFRPTLLLLVARLGGPAGRAQVVLASVVELIHAAALIHDDSVDKSALRRGRPTVNHLWNDNVAIVIGDFLYSKAFQTMVALGLFEEMKVLAGVTHHMSIGEALEIEHEGRLELSEREYLDVIAAKTASLMAAACQLGAMRRGNGAGAERFRSFGDAVGMAFQITDDVFDFVGDPAETGKRRGTDLREGKVTLPLIHARKRLAPARRDRLEELALRRRLPAREFQELVGLIEEGGGFRSALRRAQGYAREAKRHLEGEPAGPIRAALERAVDYAVSRTH